MVPTKKSPLSLIHLPYLPYIYIFMYIYDDLKGCG